MIDIKHFVWQTTNVATPKTSLLLNIYSSIMWKSKFNHNTLFCQNTSVCLQNDITCINLTWVLKFSEYHLCDKMMHQYSKGETDTYIPNNRVRSTYSWKRLLELDTSVRLASQWQVSSETNECDNKLFYNFK